MSDDSLPAPEDQHKPDTLIIKMLPCDVELFGYEEIRLPLGDRLRVVRGADEPAPKPPRRRAPRKSGLYAVLHAAQQHGFTPPSEGFWVMLPKEFDAILALEHKAIAQVVLEVLRQTIGTVEYGQDGHKRHREWAPLSVRHFDRAGILSRSQAEMGIKQALAKGYITRRPLGARRFEYTIRWRGTN